MHAKQTVNTVRKIFTLFLNATLLALTIWETMPVPEVAAATTGYVQEMDNGGYHTCALTSDNEVKCWGYNGYGQLGDGTSGTNRWIPVDVRTSSSNADPLSSVTAIALGGNHTCALMSDTSVKCWGSNSDGQLGNPTVGTSSSSPVEVCTDSSCTSLLSGVSAIAAGENHTCAVMSSGGGVKCWGDNTGGQIGDNSTTDRSLPTDVSGLTGTSAVAAGYFHTCALVSGGVKCWGNDQQGQLGDNTAAWRSLTPVDVCDDSGCSTLLSNVSAITAGYNHSCAIVGGGAMCWGDNANGQMGDDSSPADNTLPEDVTGLTNGVSTINAGQDHTCIVTTSGAVKCWGDDDNGQLGNSTPLDDSDTPVDVSGLGSGANSVFGAWDHSCALMADGVVKCWGDNAYGQLGDGTGTDRSTPVNQLWMTTYVNPSVTTGLCGSNSNGPCYTTLANALSFTVGTSTFNGTVTVQAGTYAESLTLSQNSTVTFEDGVAINALTQSNGTINAPSGTLSIAGDLTRTGGTFTHNSGSIVFNGSGTQTLTGYIVFNNVTVNNSSTLSLATEPPILGALTNNGALQQSKTVNAALTVFLNLSNGAGTQKYWGVEINPGTNNLGNTTVTVFGNQFCPNVNTGVKRCFEISPTTQATTSLSTFFYTEAERNSQTVSTMNLYHWNSGTSQWDAETIAGRGTTVANAIYYIQASGIDNFSPFAAGNSTPTAIELASFTASLEGDATCLTWETATELDNVGFNVYRADDPKGPWTKLNATLIPSQSPGSVFGATYTWLDETIAPNQVTYYRLEDVDTGGVNSFSETISITAEVAPNAVTVQQIAAQGAVAILPYGLAMVIGTIAFVTKRRRR